MDEDQDNPRKKRYIPQPLECRGTNIDKEPDANEMSGLSNTDTDHVATLDRESNDEKNSADLDSNSSDGSSTNSRFSLADFEREIYAGDCELSNPDFQPGLCARCRNVRWSALVKSQARLWWHRLFSVEESREKLLTSTCELCRFLGDFLEPGTTPVLELKALADQENSWEATKSLWAKIDPNNSTSFRERHVYFNLLHHDRSADTFTRRATEGYEIDFTIAHEWLDTCQTSHVACQPKGEVSLPGFRVIDCYNKSVVSAPNDCKYVALSYVWGSSNSCRHGNRVDACCPATIHDSIAVTLAMGFQYLWIDRYCIDQQNNFDKHIQIKNMDTIYAQAQLTIVAAAGCDANYGLPGVGSRPRKRLRRLAFANVEILEHDDRHHEPITASRWANRGWTFQEGCLSKRRLVFTDLQMSFICNEIHNDNSVQHELSRPTEQRWLYNDIFPAYRSDSMSLWSTLNLFMKREFSFEQDILDACRGFLNSTCKHIWGLPFNVGSYCGKDHLHLSWYHEHPARRREGFPSWSWTGWFGSASYEEPFLMTQILYTVDVPTDNAGWQSLPEYFHSESLDRVSARPEPAMLRITAPRLHPRFVKREEYSKSKEKITFSITETNYIIALLSCEKGLDMILNVTLDEELEIYQLQDVVILVIYMATDLNWTRTNSSSILSALIVRQTGAKFERVGIIELRYGEYLAHFERDTEGKKPSWLKNADLYTVLLE